MNITTSTLLHKLQAYQFVSIGSVPSALCKEVLAVLCPDLEFLGLVDIAGESFVFKCKRTSKSPFVEGNTLAGNTSALKIAMPNVFGEKEHKSRLNWSLNPTKGKDVVAPNIMKQRFLEGCNVQHTLYNNMSQDGFFRDFCVPAVYRISKDPLFCEMEWMDGVSIVRWLKEKRDLVYNLNAFVKLLDCIKYVHDFQVIHRDLKGNNIMYTTSDRVCVLDWTVARVLGSGDRTMIGTPIGTPMYASPKILHDGAARDATYPDDVYALGYVFWELVQSEILRKPEGLDLLDNQDLLKFRTQLASFLPKPLVNIFLKATDMDEAARYQITTEFKDELLPAIEILRKEIEQNKLYGNQRTQRISIVVKEDKLAVIDDRLSMLEARIGVQEKFIEDLKLIFAASQPGSSTERFKPLTTAVSAVATINSPTGEKDKIV